MTTHQIQGIDVPFTPLRRPFGGMWTPYEPGKRVVLPRGWRRLSRLPLPEALIWDKDVAVKMRDGKIIRADIFRAASQENEKLPALIPWSPYGKTGTGLLHTHDYPYANPPKSATSGLEKAEGPDPAEWCGRGYAIVQPDARGTYYSEGDQYVYGTQEARDGYDTIEWAAEQSWCNGSVALVGNSWLGAVQWFIAAEKPPHLKAIAPWEGVGDFYREQACRGGIPGPNFWTGLQSVTQGMGNYEDITAMTQKYPHMNAYWEDKKPRLDQIDVPMYVTMSYSTGLHTEGSYRGWKYSSSKEKWLRIHSTQEWHDLYVPDNNDDLQRFLDHYLLGKDNGWENTPKVRVSLLRYGGLPAISHRPEDNYPPSRTQYHTLYLDAAKAALSYDKPTNSASKSYQAGQGIEDDIYFTYTFNKYTEILGPSKAKLFMSTKDQDDLDVYLLLRKLDIDGNVLTSLNVPLDQQPLGTKMKHVDDLNLYKHQGPTGRLRASKRALGQDPLLTEEQLKSQAPTELWLPYDKEEKVPPGTVVELDIPIWPTGMVFKAGESLRMEISGHINKLHESEGLWKEFPTLNNGVHTVHTGQDFLSQILLPLLF